MDIAAIVTLLLGLLDRASSVGALLKTLHDEGGRDPTPAELDALVLQDSDARRALVDAINVAKNNALSAPPVAVSAQKKK